MEFDMVDNAALGTLIKVIGVGGGGGNAVEHMIDQGVQGVEFICANTDAQALSRSGRAQASSSSAISGLGAGSKPEKGREAGRAAARAHRDAMRGAHMLFITAGMGGGTGTGAAPDDRAKSPRRWASSPWAWSPSRSTGKAAVA